MALFDETSQDPHKKALQESMKTLLESGLYADMRFTCEGRDFPTHRAFVCPRSPVIQRMLQEGQGQFAEADARVVPVNEFTATTLERMLQYLYTMNYDDGRSNAIIARKFAEHEEEMPIIIAEVDVAGWNVRDQDPMPSSNGSGGSPSELPNFSIEPQSPDVGERSNEFEEMVGMVEILLINVDVYAIAGYYDVPSLRDLATEKVADLLNNYPWDQAGFLDVLHYMYEKIPEKNCPLRDTAIRAAAAHVSGLVETYGDSLPSALGGKNDLAGDLLTQVAARLAQVDIDHEMTKCKLRQASRGKGGRTDGWWTY